MPDYPKQFELDLDEFQATFQEAMQHEETQSEHYWQSLSKEDQLKVFCAVVRRIYQAEVVDHGSYRHALYNVFGFGPESYALAQMSGYLTLHNLIVPETHDLDLLTAFCKTHNLNTKLVLEFLL